MTAVGPLRLAAAVLLILSDPALALAQSTRALRPVDAATAESHVGAVRHPLLGSTLQELPARPASNICSAIKNEETCVAALR